MANTSTPSDKNLVPMPFKASPEMKQKIQAEANALGISHSEHVRNLVAQALAQRDGQADALQRIADKADAFDKVMTDARALADLVGDLKELAALASQMEKLNARFKGLEKAAIAQSEEFKELASRLDNLDLRTLFLTYFAGDWYERNDQTGVLMEARMNEAKKNVD